MSCEQNAGQNHNTKTGNKSSESAAKFRYLGTTLTDQNCIYEEIRRTLNSGNALLLFSSGFFFAALAVKKYKY
jgi:hypothetical protein